MLPLSFLTMVFFGFVAMTAADYEQTRFIVPCVAAAVAAALLYHCIAGAVRGKVTGRLMVIAGFSLFCFADIAKYFAFEHVGKYVEIRTATDVAFLMALGFFLFIVCSRPPADAEEGEEELPGETLRRPESSAVRLSLVLLLAAVGSVVYFVHPEYYKHAYFGILNYFAKAVIIYLVYIYFTGGSRLWLLCAAVLSALVMVDTSRRAFLAVLIPVGVLVLEHAFRQYSKLKKSVVVTVALVALYVFLNFLRGGHDFGHGYKPGDHLANTINYVVSLRSIDTFYNTCYVYANVPDNFDRFYGETYLAVLVGLVPRSVWPDKPVGFAAPLALMQRTGLARFDADRWQEINQFSLSPGFHGEALANFGVPGLLLLSILLGIAVRYYDRCGRTIGSARMRDINKLCLLPLFFLLVRGDFYSASIYVLFIFVFVVLIDRFVIAEAAAAP